MRLSKEESFKEFQFSKFVQVFSTLAESDPFDEGVPFETLKKSILNLGIAKKTDELNNLLNEALSKDLIEESNVR